MENEYQPLYRLRLLLQREIWHRIANDHMFDRDDANTETFRGTDRRSAGDWGPSYLMSYPWRCEDVEETISSI